MKGSRSGVRGRVEDKPVDKLSVLSGNVVYPRIEGSVLLFPGLVALGLAVEGGEARILVFALLEVFNLLPPGVDLPPLNV